jgi:hypothetical protein
MLVSKNETIKLRMKLNNRIIIKFINLRLNCLKQIYKNKSLSLFDKYTSLVIPLSFL